MIERWGKTAGYTVIVNSPDEWQLGVRFSQVGTFEEVLQNLVRGFSRDGVPPSVRVHANKVIKIGSAL